MNLFKRLKRRGVLRVAASYGLIAWLFLQIADVTLEPLGIPEYVMTVLIVLTLIGFPIALLLSWFFEFTPEGITKDQLPEEAERPPVAGIRRYADVLIIGALLVTVAALLARQGGLLDEEQTGTPVIAVLPFSNMSADVEYDYFGDGLADTMIQKLGQLNQLMVLASSSSFSFKGKGLDILEIGTKLGASTVLEGSVQRAGETLRINTRLVEVITGKQLWAGSFDRRQTDLFAIQDEIAMAVTSALQLVLTPENEERILSTTTDNLSAYDAYLLGQARLTSRLNENYLPAVDYFKQAIALDPEYALAYTGLVEAYYLIAHKTWLMTDWSDMREEAFAAAEKARSLNPGLGEVYLALAMVADADHNFGNASPLPEEEMLALVEKSIELSPNSAMALKYAIGFVEMDGDQTLDFLTRASRLDPRSGIIKVNIAEEYERRGEYETALHWYRQSAYSGDPYFSLGYSQIIKMHMWLAGQPDEAARWGRAFMNAHPEDYQPHLNQYRALLDLGAWEQIEEMAGKQEGPSDNPQDDSILWINLIQGSLMARARGNLDSSVAMATEFSALYLETLPDWPIIEGYGPAGSAIAALALQEIRAGRLEDALARYEASYPERYSDNYDPRSRDLMHPYVMKAVLYKLLGQAETAADIFTDMLNKLKQNEAKNPGEPAGFLYFVIHAFAGQKEEALAALKTAIERPYYHHWFLLKDGAFDPDYAAVMADPRFEELYARLLANVDQLRHEYLAQPDLPEGWMR